MKECILTVVTSIYWPTQKDCIDSLVSSNCRAASKATTGSSPANWAVKTRNHSNFLCRNYQFFIIQVMYIKERIKGFRFIFKISPRILFPVSD